MKYVIWDLDNCLSDDAWRIPFIDWSKSHDERYEKYHLSCDLDKPANVNVFQSFGHIAIPVIFTGRPERVRDITVAWLVKHFWKDIPFDLKLFMRPNGERLKSATLKRAMLFKFAAEVAPLRDILTAFDDRQDIVDMYRSCCIPAAILKVHDTCAYTNPMEKKDEG